MVVAARAPAQRWSNLRLETQLPSDIETLLNAHFEFIWRVLRRMGLLPADADDAAQQVFMIAAGKLDQMTPGKERAYLYGIALRVKSHAHRARRRRREVAEEAAGDPTCEAPTADRIVELRQARDLLDELLERLPEKLRRTLILAEIEELEVGEVATLEQIPVGTAASRLRLARARFRELLLKHKERNPFEGDA